MNYYIKKINSKESVILDKLNILKRYGLDISEYKKKLDSIIELCDSNEQELCTENKAVLTLQKERVYVDTIKELDLLEKELDDKQIYIQIHFKNSSLFKEVQSINNFDKERINDCVKECIGLLYDVYNLKTDSVSESKTIIKNIYKTIYEVIKFEIIEKYDSDLLKYLINNNIGLEYINDLVRTDIESIKKNNKYDEEIDKIIDEICKEGINSNLANLELLFIILLKSDDRIIQRLKEKSSDFEKKVDELIKEKNEANSKLYDIKPNINKNDKKINNDRICALLGAICLILNIISFKYLPNSLKKKNTTTTYLSTRQSYNTYTDETKTEEIYIKDKEKEFTRVYVYEPVKPNGNRIKKTYNLSKVELDNIEDYVTAAKEKSSYSESMIYYDIDSQPTRDEYATVERMIYGESREAFDQEKYESDYKVFSTILKSLIAYFGIHTVAFMLLIIKHKKRKDAELKEYEKNTDIIYETESKIAEYKQLKKELSSLIEGQDEEFDSEKVKKLLLK